MVALRALIYSCLFLFLSSCFEIIEDVTINPDGSGQVKLILNASQSKTDIDALMVVKEVNGYRVPSISQIEMKLKSFTDSVKQSPGFSNVFSKFDSENYIIIFNAKFDKVERLNTGIFNLWSRYDSNSAVRETYFAFKNQTFYRTSGTLFNLLYKKMKDTDRKVLYEATYTSLYRFNQTVDSQRNPLAIISKNKKVVFLKIPVMDLVNNSTHWKNTIKLKP